MAEIKTLNVDDLYRIIRKFGYTTAGQTSEIVDAIEAAVLSANAGKDVQDEQLHKFINCAAGDGLILDGVDAADLYVRLFPQRYAEECKSIYTGAEVTTPTQQAIDAGKV